MTLSGPEQVYKAAAIFSATTFIHVYFSAFKTSYSNPERQSLLSLTSSVVRSIGASQTQNSSINRARHLRHNLKGLYANMP
jgi:hypothetical protein